jgi:CDP-diacylglycerol--serine O-phosphatidyltransferase
MKLLRHLPNAFTCGNLLCGMFGILFVAQNPESGDRAAYFLWGACIFDFLDGFVARLLKVSSPIGKELDSLADMVTFGVLPSLVLYNMIFTMPDVHPAFALVALLIAVFSALRLAKFNIDENQKDSFIGLPTPAAGLFITALPFLPEPVRSWIDYPAVLVMIAFLVSFLLVAPFELFALKFKNFTWADNRIRFTFILLSVLLLALWQAGAISLIILLYIAISLGSRVLGVPK